MNAGDFLSRQCKALLENRRQALLCAVVLSVLPFASWLSVALVALVTLRKGTKAGFDVLLPALVVHSVPLMMLMPSSGALINTLIEYLPCFFAAIALRETQKWQVVFGVLLAQVIIGCLLIQLLIPDFIVGQFNHLKSILLHYEELLEQGFDGLNSLNLAQLFFGIQLLSAVVSTIFSLMFARSIQAKLFLPGGFKSELLAFRSGRFALLVLIAVSAGSYYEIALAINILPIMLAYFLASGFGVAYCIFTRKSQFKVFVLLLLIILLKPAFVLFAYIVLGSADSLFNFRSYLPERVRESI